MLTKIAWANEYLLGVSTRTMRNESATMRTKTAIIITMFLTIAPIAWAQTPTPPDPKQAEAAKTQRKLLDDRAAVIKPLPTELKWQQIPWLTDLTEGQRLAKEEKRPIFLWASGDDPLERC